jgi:thioredoxin 1
MSIKEEINTTSKGLLTLVKVGAPWCGPCRVLKPVIERVKHSHEGVINTLDINVDEESEWAGENNITTVPQVIFYKDGIEVARIKGVQSESLYTAAIASHR